MAANHYEVLEVGRVAFPESIKNAAERRKNELREQGGSSAEFQRIDEALATLLDPVRRERYDEGLRLRDVEPAPIETGQAEPAPTQDRGTRYSPLAEAVRDAKLAADPTAMANARSVAGPPWGVTWQKFAGRVRGQAEVVTREERNIVSSAIKGSQEHIDDVTYAQVRAPCADWLFVLEGEYVRVKEGEEDFWRTIAGVRYRSAARGRHGQRIPLGNAGEFTAVRGPTSWYSRITGRSKIWQMGYWELGIIKDVDRLVRLHDAFKTTMVNLYRAGEAERGPSDW